MMHEVSVLCMCPNVEQCSTERYVSDVRIAIQEVEMQQRALQLIADVSSAFVIVQGIMRKKRR